VGSEWGGQKRFSSPKGCGKKKIEYAALRDSTPQKKEGKGKENRRGGGNSTKDISESLESHSTASLQNI